MKRIRMIEKNDVENLIFHLSRYKFIVRQLKKTDTVIECGCGSGYGTYFLSNYCRSIVGLDINQDLIEECRCNYQSGNIEYRCLNLLNTDISKFPKYDVVVSLEVIEHMSRKDALKFMNKLISLKKDEGIVFLSTPRKLSDELKTENRKKYHIHEYTYDELKSDLSKIFQRVIILGQLDEIIGSLHPNNVWTYFCICW